MMRWFPVLRRMPFDMKKELVDWLNGHARALVYLEGLMNEILATELSQNHISEKKWRSALETALHGAEKKLVDEDLMLEQIWKRLDSRSKVHLKALTALRRPAPKDAISILGDETERLKSYGLITRYGGDSWGLHTTVYQFVVGQEGKAGTGDHKCIGLWFRIAYESNENIAFAEEAVYHLTEAGEGKLASPIAIDVSKYYRVNLRYADSLDLLNRVIALDLETQQFEILIMQRGDLNHILGRFESAKQDFEAALKSVRKHNQGSPSEGAALHGLGNALDNLGRYQEAVEVYSKSLEIKKEVYGTELNADYSISLHGFANALVHRGRYEEAVEVYSKSLEIKKEIYGTELHREYAVSLHGLADALNFLNRLSEAEKAYRKSLEIKKKVYGTELHPFYASSLHGLGNALIGLGRHGEGMEAYSKSLEIKKKVYGTELHGEYAASLYGLGNAFTGLDRYGEAADRSGSPVSGETVQLADALKLSQNVAGKESSDYRIFYSVGFVYAYQGLFEDALEYFDKVLETNPNYWMAHYKKGFSLSQLGQYDKAIQCYDKSIQIFPKFIDANYQKGIAYDYLGNLEKAIESFEYALKIDPENTDILNSLGYVLKNAGKLDEALGYFNRVLAINPKHKNAGAHRMEIKVKKKGYTLSEFAKLSKNVRVQILSPPDD